MEGKIFEKSNFLKNRKSKQVRFGDEK
jgi:hypothetical protein